MWEALGLMICTRDSGQLARMGLPTPVRHRDRSLKADSESLGLGGLRFSMSC